MLLVAAGVEHVIESVAELSDIDEGEGGADSGGVERGLVDVDPRHEALPVATDTRDEGDGDESDLRVTGCGPVCFVFAVTVFFFSASVFIVALQVLPKQRQTISPLFTA